MKWTLGDYKFEEWCSNHLPVLKFTGKLLKNRLSWKPPKLTESEWEVRGQYNVPFYKLPTQLLCTPHHKRLLLRTIYLWGHPLPWTTLYTELQC